MAKAPKKKQKSKLGINKETSTSTHNLHKNSKPKAIKRTRKSFPKVSPFQRSSKYRGVTRFFFILIRYIVFIYPKILITVKPREK